MRISSVRFVLAAVNLAVIALTAIFFFEIMPMVKPGWLPGAWLLLMAYSGSLTLWCLATGVRLRFRGM